MNTLRIKTLKPRNPLVAASRMRHAGAHRTSTSGLRQQGQAALRRELRELDRPRHSP